LIIEGDIYVIFFYLRNNTVLSASKHFECKT